MKYCCIFFHRKKFRHFDTSRFAHAVQIIPLEINDHKKFTLILLWIFEFISHKEILFQSLTSFSRSLDRTCIHMSLLHLKESLRWCTDNLKITVIHIAAKWWRIVFSQIIKNIQWFFVALYLKLLRHICDIDITFDDISNHLINSLFVFFFFKIWCYFYIKWSVCDLFFF